MRASLWYRIGRSCLLLTAQTGLGVAAAAAGAQDDAPQTYVFYKSCGFTGKDTPTDAEMPSLGSAFQQQMLFAINQARLSASPSDIPGEDVQSLPCLKWSRDLADSARDAAEECIFDHQSFLVEDPDARARPATAVDSMVGETMALTRLYENPQGTSLTSDGNFVAHMWTNKGLLIQPNKQWVASHFKQVLWSKATHVGCAVARCYADGVRRVAVAYNPSAAEKGELTVCHFYKRAKLWELKPPAAL